MRNMVLLIDTNVVLDVLQKRGILFDPSCRILELCANRQVQGYIAFHFFGIFCEKVMTAQSVKNSGIFAIY